MDTSAPRNSALRIKRWVNCLALVISAVLIGYSMLILSAGLGWGGHSPNPQIVGSFDHYAQALMSGRGCDGITQTTKGTWLVSTSDSGQPEDINKLPATAIRLEGLIPKGKAEDKTGFLSRYMDKSEVPDIFTVISRLDEQQHFQIVATVPSSACLHVTPDGSSAFLVTGLWQSKDGDTTSFETYFRSDDQGKSWSLMPSGWFPEAKFDSLTSTHFVSNQEVWAIGTRDVASHGGSSTTGVYHSNDQGRSAQAVVADILKQGLWNGEPTQLERAYGTGTTTTGDVNVEFFLAPLDGDRVRVWLSRIEYDYPDGPEGRSNITLSTNQATMQREGSSWRMDNVEHVEHLFIKSLSQTPDGRIFAIIYHDHWSSERLPVLAMLDTTTLQWRELGALPSPYSPLKSSAYVNGLYAGRKALVVSVSYRHNMLRWLYPFGNEAATVNGEATYYSLDQGHSWTKLALPRYGGAIGFNADEDRMFWLGKDAPFDDKHVRAYDLR